MKLHLFTTLATAALLLTPGTARAQESGMPPAANAPAHATLQRNANESAQATTDMSYGEAAGEVQNVSYGGVAAGQTEMGAREYTPCSGGPQCRVYFGR